MDFEQIRYEKSDGIATITLNRPERMNAFTPKMLDGWLAALQDAHLDAETRVIGLTREGRGFCTGMDMASICDIRIAADTARFGMTYLRMGLIPGDGGCYYLPRIAGVARALDLIWSGRLFHAEEALRIGYVSEVIPAEELMDYTREDAREGPRALVEKGEPQFKGR